MRRLAILLVTFFLSISGTVDAATLSGVVRDPDGRPVPGARVLVTGATPGIIAAATDDEGRFELEVSTAGRHEVRVIAEGFAADPQIVETADASQHELSIALRVTALTESLVVSAAHVDLPLSEAATTVDVVSGADLAARQVRTLADALRTVPGLAVAQNGTADSLSSLFTRGGESDFTLVLIDGMRANAFGGGLDLSQVPLVDAERIEIVRGPQSAVFGSDAIGGVVQIVTRRCAAPGARCRRLDATLEGGGLGSLRGRAAAAGSRAAFTWTAHAERAQSEGYRGRAPATGELVSNDDSRTVHAGGGLGWRHADGAEIQGRVQLSSTERGFPGAYGANPIGAYTAVDRVSRGENDRRQIGLAWTQPWGDAASRVRQRTEATVTAFESTFVSPFGTSESDTGRRTFRTQTDIAVNGAVGVSGGVEVLRERAGSTFITGERFEPIPVKRWSAGYFGEVRLSPTARLSLAAGLRIEQIRREALAADPSPFAPRPAFAEETVASANPRLAVAYLLRGTGGGASTRVRASAGTGIRPPDAFEIAFTDNPALKPERSRSVDAGVEQTFAGGAVVVEATAFFNEYDDLIVAVGRSLRDASRYRTDNISNARSRGLELTSGVRPAAWMDVRAAYTLLEAEILAVDGGTAAPAPYRAGERLIRRPRHRGSLTTVLTRGRATAFVELQARGAVRDIEPTFGASGGIFDAPGYTVLDLGGTLRLARGVELFARVENAGDRRYEEAFGFPAPGRLVMGGVRVAAGR